jgi:hypothetical protein
VFRSNKFDPTLFSKSSPSHILVHPVLLLTMRGIRFELVLLVLSAARAKAVSTVYITDLPAFTALAPCAAEAVSQVVNGLSFSVCPPDVTGLESCACTENQNSAQVTSDLSNSVRATCGSTATDDQFSASIVFSNYCNQIDTSNPLPPPTNGVTQYITDLPQFNDLGSCAGDGLNSAIESLTFNQCPPDAPSLVSCACLKGQHSLAVSEAINRNVHELCGTTHTEDVTSAQAIFAGYCGLNNGTSSFPTPSELPGSLTYYITDLPQFSELVPCASRVVYYEAFFTLSYFDCPSEPGALASCACAKDGNSESINNAISSGVKETCTSTDTADITSALSVFGLYCSAAMDKTKAHGITTSGKSKLNKVYYGTTQCGSRLRSI